MNRQYKYKVIEDNGGGLTLFVLNGRGRAIYAHAGYEYNPGQLTDDLDVLDKGTDINDWEGCEDDPQGVMDNVTSYEYGWKLVAERIGGKRKLYKHNMGAAAQLEFGVTDEDRDTASAAAQMGKARKGKKATASRENGKRGGRPRKMLQNSQTSAVQSNQEDTMDKKQKYTVQHTGYPVAGRPIDESEWGTLSTHDTESAAHKKVTRSAEHLQPGQWDDHYRVIGPDGQRCSREQWLAQEDMKRVEREYKKSRFQ